jgi:hypothetical protein
LIARAFKLKLATSTAPSLPTATSLDLGQIAVPALPAYFGRNEIDESLT